MDVDSSTMSVNSVLSNLQRQLLKPMESSDDGTITAATVPTQQTPASTHLGYQSEKTYTLTEKQLYDIISRIVNDLQHPSAVSGSVQPPTTYTSGYINTTAMASSTDLSTEERTSMLIFVLVFFLWYGGLIFICLIGLGVYKKPRSKEIYEKFVARSDIREKLKQQKEEERKQRRMMRQSSDASMLSTRSLDLPNGHGRSTGYISPRSLPSTLVFTSLVQHEEEDEDDIETDSPSSPSSSANQGLLNSSYNSPGHRAPNQRHCIFEV